MYTGPSYDGRNTYMQGDIDERYCDFGYDDDDDGSKDDGNDLDFDDDYGERLDGDYDYDDNGDDE